MIGALSWACAIVTAATLIAGGGLYIRARWRRSPQAYRAMVALAVCYFVAGSILGAWVLHLTVSPKASPPATAASPGPVAFAPSVNPSRTALPSIIAPFGLGTLNYDPVHAALPDMKLTPGDLFRDATRDDVCTRDGHASIGK